VAQLVAGVQRTVVVVDRMAKLPQGGAMRVLCGARATAATGAFIGGAECDATIERFGARISVALVANFVALLGRAAAGVSLVTEATEDFAFELERGASPVSMSVAALPGPTIPGATTAAAWIIGTVVVATRKHEQAAGNDEAQAEADQRFHVANLADARAGEAATNGRTRRTGSRRLREPSSLPVLDPCPEMRVREHTSGNTPQGRREASGRLGPVWM
jgi:hypothetical protein